MGHRCPAGTEGGEGHRPQHRRARVQDPLAALLLLHDLQVRHRRLHRAEAHLRWPGLDDLQAFRRCQGLAGHDRAVEGGGGLAAAEGVRSAARLVGGGRETGADAGDATQHLAAVRRRAGDRAGADHQPGGCGVRHAAGDLPDAVPRQPEDHHPHRPEAAVRLCRLVAAIALRQQRGEAVRRQGRALGARPTTSTASRSSTSAISARRRYRRCRCRPIRRCCRISTR